MTYQEFYEKLIDLDININTTFGEEIGWEYQKDHSHPKKKIVRSGRDAIVLEWEVSGSKGGNCWREGQSRPYTLDIRDPNFDDLDKILKEFASTITYFEYKKLWDNIVYRDERTETEYYGNYICYNLYYVYVEDLYNYLKKLEQSDSE